MITKVDIDKMPKEWLAVARFGSEEDELPFVIKERAVQNVLFNYDPNQPRDKEGQWTQTGEGISKIISGKESFKSKEQYEHAAECVGKEHKRMLNNSPYLQKFANKHLPAVKLIDDYLIDAGEITGAYTRSTATIQLAAKVFSSSQLSLGNWAVDNSLTGNYRHEFGHHIQNKLRGMQLRWKATIFDWSAKQTGNSRKWQSLIKLHVSEYASSNLEEAFAESFCAYTHRNYGKGGGKKLPKAIELFFDDLFDKPTVNILLNYDPNQPRDKEGQWTDGGGSVVYDSSTLEHAPREYEFKESSVSTEAKAEAEFYRAMQVQYPRDIPLFHEAPLSALDSIRKNGLTSNESVEDTNFATIGKPSGFVTTQDKLIVEFYVWKKDHNRIRPDMRYLGENGPAAELLKEHKGVFGADVAIEGSVGIGMIGKLHVIKDGKYAGYYAGTFGDKLLMNILFNYDPNQPRDEQFLDSIMKIGETK